MAEILTIGEPLVLFAAQDQNLSLTDATRFHKFLAGAEVNVAIGAKRLGHSVKYVSAIGDDPLGHFVLNQLKMNQIETEDLHFSSLYPTGVEFKNKTNHGDPETFYLRKNSAAAHISPRTINQIDFANIKLVHLTGIFPALSTQTLMTTRALITNLNYRHLPLSFDPNLRPSLWTNTNQMSDTVNEIAKQATIFLPGRKEAELLSGLNDPAQIAAFYFSQSDYLRLIVVKDGASGAYLFTKHGQTEFVKGFHVTQVVDTVGAGDGFALGLITALLEGKTFKEALIRANAVGALAVTTQGDNDGYPTPTQLKDFLQKEMIEDH